MSKAKGPELSHPVTRDGKPVPFFPVGRRLIVERLDPEKMAGSIHIPDTAQVQMNLATVLAAGPVAQGVLDDAGIAIGDTIALGKYSGLYWEWQPEGTEGAAERRKVDICSVDDILGCKELAEKMFDGRLGIDLYHPEGGGDPEYRFMKPVGLKAVAAKE